MKFTSFSFSLKIFNSLRVAFALLKEDTKLFHFNVLAGKKKKEISTSTVILLFLGAEQQEIGELLLKLILLIYTLHCDWNTALIPDCNPHTATL